MYPCIYVSMYLCIHVCIYVSLYLCIYVCMYACMYACMFIYTIEVEVTKWDEKPGKCQVLALKKALFLLISMHGFNELTNWPSQVRRPPATILGPDEVEINSHQLLGELPSYVFWYHLVMKIYLWWIFHRSCEQWLKIHTTKRTYHEMIGFSGWNPTHFGKSYNNRPQTKGIL